MSKGVRITVIVVSILLSLAILAVLALLIAGGAFVKPKYLEPWNKEYHKEFSEPRKSAAAHGLLAPNNHNLQSWSLSFPSSEPDTMYIYINPEREIAADPTYRENFYTQGAFIGYTEAAANKMGYKCVVETMPKGAVDEQNLKESLKTVPVARIKFTAESGAKDSDLSALYDHIFAIDVNRAPYKPDKPTQEQIEAITGLGKGGIELIVKDAQEDVSYIAGKCIEGKKSEYGTKQISTQLEGIFRSNGYSKNKFKYGMSLEGAGVKGANKIFQQGILTLMPWLGKGESDNKKAIKESEKLSKTTPAYIMITDKDNTRESQIEVGRLYSHLVLKTQAMGLVVQPQSQAVGEFGAALPIRAEMNAKFAPDSSIAMLIRLGKPTMEFPLNIRENMADTEYKEP